MPANLESSAVIKGLEKVSFHSNSKERQCQRIFKLPHNFTHLICYQNNAQNSPSQSSTVHELWTSRCSSWIQKSQRNQRSNCQHPLDYWKSKRVSEKHLLYWLCQSLWLCGSQQTVENFFKRWEYQTTWPASWEICMQVKKQQLELDMGQQTGSKLGKEYIKAVYCHPAYLTCMQSTLCEMPGWSTSCMKYKVESRFQGEISITSDMQMTPPLWQKMKRN